jgi:outer membrane protein assembly factor BamE (lipoprotein component of BamABCDE complex)
MRGRLGFIFFVLLLAGCATTGRDFPTFPMEKLQASVTTKDDVYAYFGEPFDRGTDTGYETWIYFYYVRTPFGRQDEKRLVVIFNRDGTVRHYSFSAE